MTIDSQKYVEVVAQVSQIIAKLGVNGFNEEDTLIGTFILGCELGLSRPEIAEQIVEEIAGDTEFLTGMIFDQLEEAARI